MGYSSVGFTMATPLTGRVALALLRPVIALAVQNREFAPLLRIPSLHFASFGLVESLRDATGRKRRLDRPFLLFFSLFDGSASAYLADFSMLVPDYIDALWGKCVRYPGSRQLEKFNHWLGQHAMPDEPPNTPGRATRYDFHGYPIDPESIEPDGREEAHDRRLAPMPLIGRALELKRRLEELNRGRGTKSITPEELRSLAVEAL